MSNRVLEGFSAQDVKDVRAEYGVDLNMARRLALYDRLFSSLTISQAHIDGGELKEALQWQQDMLMVMVTELAPSRR